MTRDEHGRYVPDLDAELTHYIQAALWSSHDQSTPEGGEPMDANFDACDISESTLAEMREDVQNFLAGPGVHEDADQAEVDQWADALSYWLSNLGEGQIGHDFWLTRNRHGAGFWDRGTGHWWALYGRLMTDAARAYGSCDLYIGDDGQVHA
jgi:hypothetical protein